MDVYEITGVQTGVSRAGVNFLQPKDSYQNLQDGFIYRQVLQSRQGFSLFAPQLADNSRVFGIFEHILPDGTKKLLAFDKNQAYKYNTITKIFDPILFGGALALYGGFNISSKDFYISGVSYPNKVNAGRFVFTGEGIATGAGSSIFFYEDSSNLIKSYTTVADNPGYVDPISGPLTKAKFVFFANGRLNFGAPEIITTQNQTVVFSAIQNASGNGENFAIAGAGSIRATTSEPMTGAYVNGQIIILNFFRSAWTLEITQDVFNPYFIRKVPGALGTNANFSGVLWNNIVKSLGKTGVLSCDGRQNLRADNKIPYFTEDEIKQNKFNLCYGGFDRINNQFIWSYLDSGSTALTQDKVLVNNYEEDTWSVYNARFSVFGQTDVGSNLTWSQIDGTSPNPSSWARWDETEEVWNKIGVQEATQKTLAGDDLGFIYELNRDYEDYYTEITGIALGYPTVVSVQASGFQAGDTVIFKNIVGTTQLNDEIFNVISATTTSITIDQDSSIFTPWISGGNAQKPISFYAETIPFNPYREAGRRCFVSFVEFLIDNTEGFLRVDVLADEQGFQIKQNVLLSPVKKPRDWVSLTVNQEADFLTFVMKQVSASAQVRVTSIRIHCQPGGMTHG